MRNAEQMKVTAVLSRYNCKIFGTDFDFCDLFKTGNKRGLFDKTSMGNKLVFVKFTKN